MTRPPLDAIYVLAILILSVALAHAAPTLKVRGALRLDCHGARRHGRLVVEGRTVDDAGKAVPVHPVRMVIQRDGTPVGFGGAVPCAGPNELEVKQGGLYFTTDEGGRFCVEVPLPIAAYDVVVQGVSTELVSGAESKLAVDLSKRALRLRFDPEPRVLALDTFSGLVDAMAEVDEDQPTPAANVPLELKTEAGAVIARATTQVGGRATFAVSAEGLGTPGRGDLVVLFPGDADTMPSEHVAPIERRALVILAPPADRTSGTPEDGVAFDVGVRTRFGNAPSGTVEALFGGVAVGAASVIMGHANVVAVFATPPTSPATLTLRYVPDEPYYVPASVATIPIEVRSPSPLRQAPLLLGALAIGVWILVGRAARKRKTMAPPTEPQSYAEGSPRIEVVAPSARGARRWAGRVVDAHDGTPVEAVRVAIERASFQAKETLASTFTGKDGAFVLEEIPAVSGAILSAEGPLHSIFERPLPDPCILEIALVSRKRRLLDRLVDWARRRGPPFDTRPEPTPLQVRKAAGADDRTAKWAQAVEQAAFDDVDVDARAEREVDDLEPR